MHNLILPNNYESNNGWNWTLYKMLAQSKMFNITCKDFPYTRVNNNRNGNWTLMEVDGITIGLDTWDTWAPTSTFKDNGFFDNVLSHVDLILKIQYYKCDYWDNFEKETNIKVRPWTVMPTKDFPLESFKWENKNHKWYGTVTGKNNRFGRQAWTDWCSKTDGFYSSGDYLVNDTLDDYINRLKECKWGIILKGKQRNHDGKNRRESEFTSCNMPLVLNYIPTYTFQMNPNEHFLYVENPDDLIILKNIDPMPYVKASEYLWNEHFSPVGIAKTLLSIIKDI